MSVTMAERPAVAPPPANKGMVHKTIGRGLHVAIGVGAIALGALSWIPQGAPNWARWVVVGIVAYCVGIYVVSRGIEGPRRAKDRLVTAIVTSAFIIVAFPLVSVVWTVVSNGWNRLDAEFFTIEQRPAVARAFKGGDQRLRRHVLQITQAQP